MAFAKANGLTVTGTHPNRTLLDVRGSVADIEKVCHVTLRLYSHPKEARTFYAPDAEPSLDLDIPVLHISGLDNYVVPRPMNLKAASSNNVSNAKPDGTGSGSGGTFLGNDFRAAYVPGRFAHWRWANGLACWFDSGFYASDITAYETLAGLPKHAGAGSFIGRIQRRRGQRQRDEVSLDIEMAISHGARTFQGATCMKAPRRIDILNRMATDNVAKQLSSSWTYPIDANSEPDLPAI